jgi:hypothetical protein
MEVEYEGKIIAVEAFYGRDGYRPHWRDKYGTCWDVSAFRRWRHVSPKVRLSDGGVVYHGNWFRP